MPGGVQQSPTVAYIDLNQDTNIPDLLMRPLFFIGFKIFSIHGRTAFHQGWSENPIMGTIEDWFIINTIFFTHPIHIHLINFQVIREFDLRVIRTNNRNQIFLTNSSNTVNYQILCDNLYPIQNLPAVQEKLAFIYPEYVVDANNVSGLDVRMRLTAQDVLNLNTPNFTISPSIDFTNLSSYKFVSNEGYPSSKLEYARWKDTANLDPFKVQQFRIRWAKSDFTEADRAVGKYFNVPNDQLREYPGFVYHCHILHHEDNEMMRPIMLQLPGNAYLNASTPCNLNATGQPMLNWSDKFACINQRCGNPS
jgi:FtsP/CotA-like multicopper oxidase with cupredoxin domain